MFIVIQLQLSAFSKPVLFYILKCNQVCGKEQRYTFMGNSGEKDRNDI